MAIAHPNDGAMRPWSMADDAAVLPTYKDIRGKDCSLEDLISIIREFSVNDWVCNLARLSCLLAGNRHRDREWYGPFLKWYTPQDIIPRLEQWERELKQRGIGTVVFTERHVGVLIELAIAHAPEEVGRAMQFPGDEGAVFDALMMVASLEQPEVRDAEGSDDLREVASTMSTLMYRSLCPDPRRIAVRGYYLFKIMQERHAGSWVDQWATLFKAATGHDIDAYYVGGLQALLVAWGQTVDELAENWRPLPNALEQAQLKNQWPSLQAYYAIRRADLGKIRALIAELRDMDRMDDVSLIPLLAYPLVHLADDRTYPLYLRGIASSLFEGVYHAVSEAALRSSVSLGASPQDVGALFGHLFEEFVLDVLYEAFPHQLLRNPADPASKEEISDGIILCPNGLILLQIKGCHLPVRHQYMLRNPDETLMYLEQSGLRVACGQVARSVKACRNGRVPELAMYGEGIKTLPIQPVVVMSEVIPVFGLSQHLLGDVLQTACPDGFTRSPILASPADVEALACLPQSDNIWDVLTGYVLEDKRRGCSLNNFLGDTARHREECVARRIEEVTDAFREYLGIGKDAKPGA